MLNNACFASLRRMATINLSNIREPRWIRSRCPLVIGSNEPGYTAITWCGFSGNVLFYNGRHSLTATSARHAEYEGSALPHDRRTHLGQRRPVLCPPLPETDRKSVG